MKLVVLTAAILGFLLPVHSTAQRVSVHAGGGAPSVRPPSSIGLPPIGPIPPLANRGNFGRFGNKGFGNGFGAGFGAGLGYPAYFDSYPDPNYYGGATYNGDNQTPIVWMSQPETCPVIAPPPMPIKPAIHEYTWSDSPSAGNPSAPFVIVMNDGGQRHQAVAVWAEGKFIRYLAPDGTGGRLPLGLINREATRSANAENHLTLQLPADTQSMPTNR